MARVRQRAELDRFEQEELAFFEGQKSYLSRAGRLAFQNH